MQNQLQVAIGVSFEGYKGSYVCPRGDNDFDWKECLVLRYDPISGENDIQWSDGRGLSRHNMSTLKKDHPNIAFEKCPPSDPLWTEDAKSAWNRYTDGKKSRPRATPNYAEGEEEEVEEEPPPRRQRREKLPPMEFLCPINLALMRDPVVCQDGYTYERNAILDWKRRADLKGTPFTSPMTGAFMGHDEMCPNHSLKSLISKFKP
jgi:hypothetical protein